MTSQKELLNRKLPKWPCHYVTGVPVTISQTKDIIRRTDTFFTLGTGGNDKKYDEYVRNLFNIPQFSMELGGFGEYSKAFEKYAKKLTSTTYVLNNWISSTYIDGPHGWCHPDGQIGFVTNVGKWPSITDILNDWKILAKTFPYLDIGVTLFDRECCEEDGQPVVSMVIRNGKVKLVDPKLTNVHTGHPKPTMNYNCTDIVSQFSEGYCSPLGTEHGIPDDWINEWLLNPL